MKMTVDADMESPSGSLVSTSSGSSSLTGPSLDSSSLRSSSSPLLHHYYHELPIDEEERLEKLFKQLDADGDGRIAVNDLYASLEMRGIQTTQENVKVNYYKLDFI